MSIPVLPACGAVVLFALVGCGPVTTPIPPRLDAAGQNQIDTAWEQALTPVNKYDNQALLDLLVTTQAYQFGVDVLSFRSEKKFSVGKVLMEIQFDRAKPAEDRFLVTVLDQAGKTLRKEQYGRQQVETTLTSLNHEVQSLRQKKTDGTATPAEISRLKTIEDRLALVENAVPKDMKKQEK